MSESDRKMPVVLPAGYPDRGRCRVGERDYFPDKGQCRVLERGYFPEVELFRDAEPEDFTVD